MVLYLLAHLSLPRVEVYCCITPPRACDNVLIRRYTYFIEMLGSGGMKVSELICCSTLQFKLLVELFTHFLLHIPSFSAIGPSSKAGEGAGIVIEFPRHREDIERILSKNEQKYTLQANRAA